MQVMAQGWVMATLTNKAIWLGMANLAAGLPMLLLTLVGGAAADRYDKRKILLITQFVQIGIALELVSWFLKEQIEIWEILAFAVVLGISNSFEMPTQPALVPELVGRSQIQSGIAIDRSVFHGSRVLGPTIGGISDQLAGQSLGIFCKRSVICRAHHRDLVACRQGPKGTPKKKKNAPAESRTVFDLSFKDKPSLAMVTLIATQSFCIFPIITVMMPLYVRLVLHLGARPSRLFNGRICNRLVRRFDFFDGFVSG